MAFNILVGQSGGPTSVINSSLYGVITAGMNSDKVDTVYGMVNGIEGFLAGKTINLSEHFEANEISLLQTTPGAFLGSCRFMLPEDMNDPVYVELFKRFEELEIGAFFYIGGNDSMDTAAKLSKCAELRNSSIRFMGVPKTVDNDLVETDHTPGFGSAAKYIATVVREIAIDAGCYCKPSVTIVELMGRHAGWLTACSVLARTEFDPNPVLIYLPEHAFDPEKFIRDVDAAVKKHKGIIVCVSEGIADANGTFICEYGADAVVDGFGHKMLAGCGKVLEQMVKEKLGIKCRSVELNLPQRCDATNASLTDINEAAKVGEVAVESALAGETGKMVCMIRNENAEGYELSYVTKDVSQICNKEKKFPQEWIVGDGTDIAEPFLDYVRPLIMGEAKVPYKDGLPVYSRPAYR